MTTPDRAPSGAAQAPAAEADPREIRPARIQEELQKSVLGQDDTLRQVALAVYKHTTGMVPGNILLIGNSGTGKTTIMVAIQRLYASLPHYQPFRSMAIVNANLLVDPDRLEFRPDRLLAAVEQQARAIIGHPATAAELKTAMDRATICIDEIDKLSAVVAGKPNPIGIVLQQGLLTLMEGSHVPFRTHAVVDGQDQPVTLQIDTQGMMFICGGAFEGLYDQVYARVISPTSTQKLKPVMVRQADGGLGFESRFSLRDFFRLDDIFQYGMVPQFIARFDGVLLLAELSLVVLKEILLDSVDSPFLRSRRFFEGLGISLELEDMAAELIAVQAARHTRTGARALRPLFGKVVNAFEYDPWGTGALQQLEEGRFRLLLTAEIVRKTLGAGEPGA
ncbi:MAG: AAA family ATPase [Deltaproteobacteria bacterium]|nr:AAA family ATPase [Deltaproteobacteria bacterium]